MTSNHPITPSFITDMLDVLDRHGYARGDDQHASRASPSSATWPASGKAPRTTRPAPTLRLPHPCPPIPNPAARPPSTRS